MKDNYLVRTAKYISMQSARKVFSVISKNYRKDYRRLKEEIKKFTPKKGDVLNILDLDAFYTDEYFSSGQFESEEKFTGQMSRAIDEVIRPSSVMDVGCGKGLFLKYFFDQGHEIRGIEGSPYAFNQMVVPKNKVRQADLRRRMSNGKKYDLAISVEVAEHIEKEFVGVYMETLTSLSDTIVFSSPPPGDTEPHPYHPNEQMYHNYWDILFKFYGYKENKEKTKLLRKKFKNLRLPIRLKQYESIKVYKKLT